MNTDVRSTAIIIAALADIQPDHPVLPKAVRWLMTVRQHGGYWRSTQETAWSIIGLTHWMVASGELEGKYSWHVVLNDKTLGRGTVAASNIDQNSSLRVAVENLLTDTANRLTIERSGSTRPNSSGRLYYCFVDKAW